MRPDTKRSRAATRWFPALVPAVAVILVMAAALGNNPPPTTISTSTTPVTSSSDAHVATVSRTSVASVTTTSPPEIIYAEDDLEFETTDTTLAEADSSTDGGIAVTDTTVVPPAATQPDRQQATATTVSTKPTTTTTGRPPIPPWVSHPTWDHRLPSTWDGLGATECHKTINGSALATTTYFNFSDLVRWAYSSSDWEPTPGSPMEKGLSYLGVSSAQDLRDMGREAADIRWRADSYAIDIEFFGDPEHPDCARILEGVAAVLTPWTG